jgi:hypothetical protein
MFIFAGNLAVVAPITSRNINDQCFSHFYSPLGRKDCKRPKTSGYLFITLVQEGIDAGACAAVEWAAEGLGVLFPQLVQVDPFYLRQAAAG